MNSQRMSSSLSEHLTEAEFGELLDRPFPEQNDVPGRAERHLQACEQCAAEMSSLRESLALFRSVATSYADDQLQSIPPVVLPVRPAVSPTFKIMVLATAAVLAVAAFLPLRMSQKHSSQAHMQSPAAVSVQTYAVESNEALLEDIDRASSASVPDAMLSLADPTATDELSAQKSKQRKD